MARPKGAGPFSDRTSIQITPATRERISRIVERDPTRHPTFSQTVREAIEIGVPKIEEDLAEDTDSVEQEVAV
jgi:hypothetical protein